ncbi:hypothetical protein Tco_1165761 [Tanacetum coccineum]
MNKLLVRLNIFEATNLPRSEFIVTLLREINEIAFVVKLLTLSWSLSCCRLVPSCFAIFDLEPLSLSFDFYVFEHEHVVMNPTSAGMRHLHLYLYMYPEIKQLAIKRVDEYGFVIRLDLVRLTSGSVGPFYNINNVPVIRTSLIHIESHHRFFPVDTSLIHIESHKSPTKSLFDVGSSMISIFTMNTKEYHSDVLAKSQG